MSEAPDTEKRYLVTVSFFQGGQQLFETDIHPFDDQGTLRVRLSQASLVVYASGRWAGYTVRERRTAD